MRLNCLLQGFMHSKHSVNTSMERNVPSLPVISPCPITKISTSNGQSACLEERVQFFGGQGSQGLFSK